MDFSEELHRVNLELEMLREEERRLSRELWARVALLGAGLHSKAVDPRAKLTPGGRAAMSLLGCGLAALAVTKAPPPPPPKQPSAPAEAERWLERGRAAPEPPRQPLQLPAGAAPVAAGAEGSPGGLAALWRRLRACLPSWHG